MKILWIGIAIGDNMMKVLKEKGGKLLSAHVSHNNIIEGLDASCVDMDSINSSHFTTSIKKVEAEKWSRNGKSEDVSVGYRNIKYFNHIFRKKALCRAARRWAEEHKSEDVRVLIYQMHSPFLAAAAEVKKIIPSAKICLIVPDLPQYMDLAMNPLKKVLKKIDWLEIKKLLKSVDKYILYAKPMAEFLGLLDGVWTVMEGLYDSELMPKEPERDGLAKKAIMYSGVLDMRYGIPELLDAMKLLDDSYELWFTGNGNAADLIKERAEEDRRIKFFGYLPSRQDLLNKQAEATMLISTRRDSEVASRYCFPSKLFEYMVSGNPVISCFLDGIPEEYHEHLIELKSVTPENIAKAAEKVSRMTEEERKAFGNKAKSFVLENKNKFAQAKKILEFVTE